MCFPFRFLFQSLGTYVSSPVVGVVEQRPVAEVEDLGPSVEGKAGVGTGREVGDREQLRSGQSCLWSMEDLFRMVALICYRRRIQRD